MRISLTLSLYTGRQFLLYMAMVLGIVITIVVLFDTLETFRRSFGKAMPFSIVIEMALLKLPLLIQQMIPFVVMLGGILTFSRLTRSYELIIARAAGISAWQFLMPAGVIALLMGILLVTVFNPLSSIMLMRFERLEAKYMQGNTSMLSVSTSGLWLREVQPNGSSVIIHALRATQETAELFDVIVFQFGAENKFIDRMDAQQARLEKDRWTLQHVMHTSPTQPAETLPTYAVPTHITLHQLQDSFSSPETISFWALPSFIKTLKAAGFSAIRHTLHWYSLLLMPLFLCAMVYIAAAFSLRLPRQGKTGMLMVAGLLTGFFIYFLSDLVAALGLTGRIPVLLAASAPVAISMLLGTALMLHLEDG